MVGDCAHVGETLAREINRQDYGVDVGQITFNHYSKTRYAKALLTIPALAFSNVDLVHAHYCRFPAYASYFSRKKYIVHCHGSDVRLGIGSLKRRSLDHAKTVLVSTPDLLEVLPDAQYLPNPVGPEFTDQHLKSRRGTVFFEHSYLKTPTAISCGCRSDGLTILNRKCEYPDMPSLLNNFEYVVNVNMPFLSKISLEALACGCKVVMPYGKIMQGLPEQHRVENVAPKLVRIYEECLST